MLVPRKLLWLLLSAASAAAAGVATRKLVDVGWRMTTGSDTPAEDDGDSASFGQALAWAAGVGAAAGAFGPAGPIPGPRATMSHG